MPLDPEIFVALKRWLDTKANKMPCSVCGTDNWSATELIAPPAFEKGNMVLGKGIPFIPLVCNNCGNTLFFAATLTGAVANLRQGQADASSSPQERRE